MKWDDLRIFLALARQSRLMSAGKSLGLDPATVSRRITVLEEAMGTQLRAVTAGLHADECGQIPDRPRPGYGGKCRRGS